MKNIVLLLLLCFFSLNIYAQRGFKQTGKISVYIEQPKGKKTLNGDLFRQDILTAGHISLPFGTMLKVTNLSNKSSIIVRINDRRPLSGGKILEVTVLGARKLGLLNNQSAQIKIEALNNVFKPMPKKKRRNKRKKKKKKSIQYNISDVAAKYYLVTSKEATPKGYGVQVGSYQNQNKIVEVVSNIRNITRNPIYVLSYTKNGKDRYKIIVGKKSTKSKAETVRHNLKKKFPDCMVISY